MTVAVWAYSESEQVANELSTAATDVANQNGGEAFVLEVGEPRPGVAASKKLVLRTAIASSSPPPLPEVVAELIFRASKTTQPSVVLVGATRQGREVASRLAAKLGSGAISDVFNLSFKGQMLFGERNVYAGRVLARVGAPTPCVAVVRVGAYQAAQAGSSGSARALDLGDVSPMVKLVGTTKKGTGTVDLRKAKIIVSAGRGVKRKEDIPLLEGLARSFGAALGCSRPLSSDLGWLPEEHHIGLTGITVSPELYVAVGISGQLQHIAGIKDSKIIAAINSDKEAPIFQAADYGVVGDLYQVVPALQKLLSAKKV